MSALQTYSNLFQLQMCVCGLGFCFSHLYLHQFISPIFIHPWFFHIYAFGLDALFALVLTQDKNLCLFPGLCV